MCHACREHALRRSHFGAQQTFFVSSGCHCLCFWWVVRLESTRNIVMFSLAFFSKPAILGSNLKTPPSKTWCSQKNMFAKTRSISTDDFRTRCFNAVIANAKQTETVDYATARFPQSEQSNTFQQLFFAASIAFACSLRIPKQPCRHPMTVR